MSDHSDSSQTAPALARGFFLGLSFAAFVFVGVHRLDLAMGGAAQVAAVALAAVIAGWWLGAECGRRTHARARQARVAAVLALVSLWLGAAFAPIPCGPVGDLFLLCVSALLLRVLFASGSGGALLCGCGVGFAAMSAGLAALVGVRWVGAGAAIIAAGASVRRAASASPSDPDVHKARAALAPAPLLLGASAVVLAVAMLRTYSWATGWWALAVSDLGVAACVGALIARGLGAADGAGKLLARALVLAAVALVLQASFLLYPYLIFSEAAALQSARSLMELGRVFPVWVLAAIVGASLTLRGVGRDARCERQITLACALGAGACLLIPGCAWYGWHYVLAVALAAAAGVSAIVPAWRSRAEVRRPVLWVASVALLVVALGWSVLGAPDLQWRLLRQAFALYQVDVPGRLNPAPVPPAAGRPNVAPSVDSVRSHPWGLTAHVSAGSERGAFVCGNLVSSSRGLDSGSVRLCVALAAASSERCERIGIIGPALTETHEGARLLAPDAKVFHVPAVPSDRPSPIPDGLDAIVCDPGPLVGTRCPLAILSVESLTGLRRALREGGVLVVWLPTRTVSPADFGRVLSTALAVFPRAHLFMWGDEAVLVCGGMGLSHVRLESLFRAPASCAYLSEGGLWDARQLLTAWTADAGRLRELASGARPYRLTQPERPPVLARDLVDVSNPGTLAVVAQCRLAGASRIAEALRFRSDSERAAALADFRALYAVRTDDAMAAVGRAARARMGGLLDALYGGQMDLNLFAPEPESRDLKVALALQRFGLYNESLRAMAGKTFGKADAFHVHYWTGRNQEALGRTKEALSSYEAALRERPAQTDVMLRLARLHLNMGGQERAAKMAEQVIAAEPQNVEALTFLAFLYGRSNRRAEAAALAERALKADPNNRLAQDLYYLYSLRAADGEP